ncbi:MAG TPA: glycosyltransferase family 2 protein [Nitrospira sp.]|nr:glycosyltransferase family 2 protein [Nitrospira sp.]
MPCSDAMFLSTSRQTTELHLTKLSLALTGAATALLLWSTGEIAWSALQGHDFIRLLETSLFGALSGFLVYGNLCYQVTRLGRLRRIQEHNASSCAEDIWPAAEAPGLTILVPSYREELSVIRQTLLSAALQEYPSKRVVLLLDDPPAPKSRQDQSALWAARSLSFDLQSLLASPYRYVTEAKLAFRSRQSTGDHALSEECVRLSDCYRWAAEWFEVHAKEAQIDSHTDVWFVEHILTQPAQACREQSAQWFARRRQMSDVPCEIVQQEIDAAYGRLATRFEVKFDVFERKQYCNLSHEPNKAMNLNSFLGIMGKRVKPIRRKDGLYLEETDQWNSRLIPDTPYVITLDADSLLQPHYARTLVRRMEQPAHARVAVAQTPYSAFPNAPGVLERTAGATTDIQYLVHQGFTRFGATFWVGANALLRKSALEDICTEEREGKTIVRRYIQDRTVIEDTESTVDLLAKGWSLYNHPERLAYSATPPDFGSLVIQRARWANGGLIIFPKLLSLLSRAPKQPQTIVQALLQTHYLTSLAFAPLSVLLLLCVPFASELMTIWMPLAALPYFALYARDLKLMGYLPTRDLLRVYALNLLLIPVHLTGAITSVRQALAGTKIPFRRTPKISGRTRTSGLDLVLQLVIVGMSGVLGIYYVSETRWISGGFALLNAALLLYGITQFIGVATLKQDLLHSAKETGIGPALNRVTARLVSWIASGLVSMRTSALQMCRARYSPRHAVWSLLLVLEVLSPALAAGTETSRYPIQLENERTLSDQNELLDPWVPLDPMEMAISVDDLPTHGKVPAGLSSRDIGKGVLAAFQGAHTPPVYGFSNGMQLTWDSNSLDVLKDWLRSGNFLGNHTFSHMNLAQSTAEAFIADIIAMDGLLTSLSPPVPPPKVFRYPYMSDGNMLGKGDQVRNFLEKNGYQIVPVTVDYKDWAWNSAYLKCYATNDEAQVQWLRQHVIAAARREVRQAQTAARLVAGRDIRHILLLHLSAFNAVTLADVLAALQADGVKFIDLRSAMDDPIYRINPDLPLPEGTTFLEQFIKAKNLLYPYGIQIYSPERIEAMCKR